MNIEFKEIKVRELADSYRDNVENGVAGFGDKLDIRPPFQREFIYKIWKILVFNKVKNMITMAT